MIIFIVALSFYSYFSRQKTYKELENLSAKHCLSLGDFLKLSLESSYRSPGERVDFQHLLDLLTEAGDLIYMALLNKKGNVLLWSSKYEGYLPIEKNVESLKKFEFVESPIGKIVQVKVPFFDEKNNQLYLIFGYAHSILKTIYRRSEINSILLALVLIFLGGAGLFFNYKLQERYYKKERELKEEKLKRERYEELALLSAGVAHEVKNPLNSISMSVQMLKRRVENSNDRLKNDCMRYINIMTNEVQKMSETIEKFSVFTKSINLNRNRINLKDFIKDLIKQNIEKIDKKLNSIRFENLIPPDIYINVDPFYVSQAISNLIRNSIEATREGLVSISANEKDGKIKIEIKDTGEGIKPEEIERVFDLFYSSKEKGMGLGLPIAKKIIEAHNGKIDIKSKEGEGTTVTITLSTKKEV
ncbi:MAG: HAMP domain-containing sensor histidine kinase [Acidobacteriota bacterium]